MLSPPSYISSNSHPHVKQSGGVRGHASAIPPASEGENFPRSDQSTGLRRREGVGVCRGVPELLRPPQVRVFEPLRQLGAPGHVARARAGGGRR